MSLMSALLPMQMLTPMQTMTLAQNLAAARMVMLASALTQATPSATSAATTPPLPQPPKTPQECFEDCVAARNCIPLPQGAARDACFNSCRCACFGEDCPAGGVAPTGGGAPAFAGARQTCTPISTDSFCAGSLQFCKVNFRCGDGSLRDSGWHPCGICRGAR